MPPWITHSRRTVLDDGRYLRVEAHRIELPDGRCIPDWPWVVTPDFVTVVAVTDEGRFLCFRQDKYAVEGLSLAPPGGYIDEGEDPLDAAKRELLEETGYVATAWQALGRFPVDGNRGCGIAHLFLARGAHRAAAPDRDDLETMEFLELTQEEVSDALDGEKVKALPWVAAFALALHALARA